jgi:hypothetical protein
MPVIGDYILLPWETLARGARSFFDRPPGSGNSGAPHRTRPQASRPDRHRSASDRHPFGKAASRRQSVGIRIDSVPNVALSGQAGKHKHRARGGIAATTAAAGGARRYTGTYPAEPAQVRHARAALAELLGGCPRADNAILIASEFATNSVLDKASRGGGEFTLRAEVRQDHVRIEVEDAGGHGTAGRATTPARTDSTWQLSPALQNWGIGGDTRGRTALARLGR